jgi:hypothetical protein
MEGCAIGLAEKGVKGEIETLTYGSSSESSRSRLTTPTNAEENTVFTADERIEVRRDLSKSASMHSTAATSPKMSSPESIPSSMS